MRPGYVKVNKPITVPDGKYCVRWAGLNVPCCDHFDNIGGHSTCEMGFWQQKDDDNGVLKPADCLNLKEVT